MSNILLYHDDAYKILPNLNNLFFNLIAIDPPYNINYCEWDKVEVLYYELLNQFKRIIKQDGNLIIFAGSGTTGEACKNLNRNCILVERENKYILFIEKRIK